MGFWAPPPDRADLLEDKDLDLGAGGALVIPGGDRLVGGGEDRHAVRAAAIRAVAVDNAAGRAGRHQRL